MEAIFSSETFGFLPPTQLYNPEDRALHRIFLRRFNFEWQYNVSETIYESVIKELLVYNDKDNRMLSLQSPRKNWSYIIYNVYVKIAVETLFLVYKSNP
jgi:hypothetical protein